MRAFNIIIFVHVLGNGSAATHLRRMSCVCGTRAPSTKVIGGRPSSSPFPWLAALVDKDTQGQRPFCGGALISDRHVLTAAHCLQQVTPPEISVVMGALDFRNLSQAEYYNVHSMSIEPRYSATDRYQRFDIAVLTLSQRVTFGRFVSPICLPGRHFRSQDFKGLKVAGWGRVSDNGSPSPALLEVEVPEVPLDMCVRLLGDKKVTSGHICAGNEEKDTCGGDSGGPLMTTESGRTTIVGVVSWGVSCGNVKYPGVYSRVWTYASFINQSTPEGRFCDNRIN